MTWTTRRADITDAPAIARVIEDSGLFTEEEADGFVGTLPDLLAAEDEVWTLVADATQTVGAAYMSRDGMSHDVWNMWFIGVLADRQGTGAGHALVLAVEALAREADARLMLIETSSLDGFETARAFYTRHGYANVAQIPDYYAPGEHKVIFSKPLAETG